MARFSFLLYALTLSAGVLASSLKKRAAAYYDPAAGGGSILDQSAGLGEPLNVRAGPCQLFSP